MVFMILFYDMNEGYLNLFGLEGLCCIFVLFFFRLSFCWILFVLKRKWRKSLRKWKRLRKNLRKLVVLRKSLKSKMWFFWNRRMIFIFSCRLSKIVWWMLRIELKNLLIRRLIWRVSWRRWRRDFWMRRMLL